MDNDDFFGADEGEDFSGGMDQAETSAMERRMHALGFEAGVHAGKERALQRGFDRGFERGGDENSARRGKITGYAGLTCARLCVCRSRFQRWLFEGGSGALPCCVARAAHVR